MDSPEKPLSDRESAGESGVSLPDEALTQALRERDACIAAVEMVADDPHTAELIKGRIGVALQRIVRHAAAPELRDALKGAMKYLSYVDTREFHTGDHLDLQNVQDHARAVLAKAGRAQAGPEKA